MEAIVTANGVEFDRNLEPDYILKDADFIRIVNDRSFRENLLRALNKTFLIISRLGVQQPDKTYEVRPVRQQRDLITQPSRKEMGYYARI